MRESVTSVLTSWLGIIVYRKVNFESNFDILLNTKLVGTLYEFHKRIARKFALCGTSLTLMKIMFFVLVFKYFCY